MTTATKEKEKAISVDDQFLKDYLARGGKAIDLQSGQEVDKDNADEYLRQATAKNAEPADKEDEAANKRFDRQQTGLQRRAEKLQAADDERIAREKARQEQEAAKIAQAKQDAEDGRRLNQMQRLRKASGQAATNLGNSVQPAIDRIGSIKTIGGIGLLLFIIVMLLFIVVQVNAAGDTRLKQLWYMLSGRATLQGRVTPTGAVPVGSTPTPATVPGTTPTTTSTTGTTPGGSGPPILFSDVSGNGVYRNFTAF